MNEKEWHEWRNNGLGASDAPVFMGVSIWKSPYQLWKEKVFKEAVPFENAATLHGKKYEDEALEWIENKTGCIFFPQVTKMYPVTQIFRATFDGMTLEGDEACEIKCPFRLENHQEVKRTRKCPDKYYPQLQHQIFVGDLNKIIFVSYNYLDPDDSVYFDVMRDDFYIQSLISRGMEFWECVVNKTSPLKTALDREIEEKNGEWNELLA